MARSIDASPEMAAVGILVVMAIAGGFAVAPAIDEFLDESADGANTFKTMLIGPNDEDGKEGSAVPKRPSNPAPGVQEWWAARKDPLLPGTTFPRWENVFQTYSNHGKPWVLGGLPREAFVGNCLRLGKFLAYLKEELARESGWWPQVNSWYRGSYGSGDDKVDLNKIVGGSSSSRHRFAAAVDLGIVTPTGRTTWKQTEQEGAAAIARAIRRCKSESQELHVRTCIYGTFSGPSGKRSQWELIYYQPGGGRPPFVHVGLPNLKEK